jgi:uncharacterized protein YbjT (DUF2867 family)
MGTANGAAHSPEGPILVTGGTGTLGRLVVARLREAGREVRILSRRPHAPEPRVDYLTGDLVKGQGIDAALEGVATVIHCAGGRKGDDVAALNLVHAAMRLPRAPHVVFISVIGADRVDIGYFRAKLAAEKAIAESGLPWTTLRAAQFYDLVLTSATAAGKLPLVPAPAGFRVQPVDPGEVADRLVELALSEPAGLVPDLAGPDQSTMADLFRSYLRATGRHRPVVQIWMPKLGPIRAGSLVVSDPEQVTGAVTWEQFLAERIAPPT